MTRPYRGESAEEFCGITCPDDVREPEREAVPYWPLSTVFEMLDSLRPALNATSPEVPHV